MHAPSPAFDAYLAPDEAVVERTRGRIVEGSRRAEGAVGVTDRRLLFVADDDRFVAVEHGSICSIRSSRRATPTAAGFVAPALALAGLLVAAVALAVLARLGPPGPTAVLALASVGGAVVAEYLRRRGAAFDPAALAALRRVARREVGVGELAGARLLRPGRGDEIGPVLAAATASLLALVGLVALTGTLLPVPLAVAAVGGLAVVEVAYRHASRLAAGGRGRREERWVSVDLVNGRRIDLRVDAGARIDRSLGEVVRAPRGRGDAGGNRPAGPAGSGG